MGGEKGKVREKAWLRYLIELGASCPENGASGSLEQSARELGTWAQNGVDWKTRGGRRQGAAAWMQQGQPTHVWREWGYESMWGQDFNTCSPAYSVQGDRPGVCVTLVGVHVCK